jgi:hypothetical protein
MDKWMKRVVYLLGGIFLFFFLSGTRCQSLAPGGANVSLSEAQARVTQLRNRLDEMEGQKSLVTTNEGMEQFMLEIAIIEDEIRNLNRKISGMRQEEELYLNGRGCFAGDTLVLGPDGSPTRIDQLKEGAQVATWDRLSGRPAEGVIAKFLQTDSDHHFLINGVIKVTQYHRVLTAQGEWVRVKDLKAGMTLQSEDGPLPVQSIILKRGHLPVYNFDVAQGDSFLVAAGPDNWLVVHNGGGGK